MTFSAPRCFRLVLQLCLLLVANAVRDTVGDESGLIVAGYLPDYRSYINLNNAAAMLTDLILFSIDVTHAGGLEYTCCLDSSHYDLAREAQAHKNVFYPGSERMKIWVALGGAGRSHGFNGIMKSHKRQANFLENLIKHCLKEKLDGVDLDWEKPSDPKDAEEFNRLVVDTANKLHEHGFLVSITTRSRLDPVVANAVDRIHFMGYDLLVKDGPKHHASLQVIKDMLTNWDEEIFKKVILGIPAYGRDGDDSSSAMTFAELVDEGLSDWSADEFNGFYFDSPAAIREKVAYVSKMGFGGTVLWEIGQDKQLEPTAPHGILLQAMALVDDSKDEL